MVNKNKDIYSIISSNIKYYRKNQKMTQQELAIKSGYSYGYIRRIESPKGCKSFSIDTICNIAETLNIEVKDLFK